jgi:hypothetical protein
MKKIYIIILLIFANSLICFGSDSQKKIHDNSGGASSKITFTAEVVKVLTIENTMLELNIGPIAAGVTKILGEKYNAVFHLSGVENAKFVIYLVNENFTSNGVTLEGLNWQYRNTESAEYTKINTFPFISQLNQSTGDGWIKVYPESIRTDQNVEQTLVYFEFKFNCSYYEL